MMQGPNVEAIAALARACGQQVIASGGVSSMADVETLAAQAKAGVSGAIIGKALYTGSVRLEEAVRLAEAAGSNGR